MTLVNSKLKFLGSGSAFTNYSYNFQSNMLLTTENKNKEGETETTRTLIDAGTQINDALFFYGLSYKDIDNLILTHCHADHAGGIEYLGFSSFFDPEKLKIILLGDQKVLKDLETLIKPGMLIAANEFKSIYDYFSIRPTGLPEPTIEITDFKHNIKTDRNFFIKSKHVGLTKNEITTYMPSTSIWLTKKSDYADKNVLITGDINYEGVKDYLNYEVYDQAEIIFQDCEFKEYEGSVHAQFRQLKDLPKEVKEKMWLYHYEDSVVRDKQAFRETKYLLEKEGFAGLVERGQEFTLK